MFHSGIRRLPDGDFLVRLPNRERQVLRSLPEQLGSVLAGEQDIGGAVERLYPRAYDAAGDEAEYREMVGDSLVEERLEALEAFARTLDGGQLRGSGWRVQLDPDEADAWLSAINDARLVLGCLLGIADESRWERGPDADDPTSMMLYYLGWLEEELVAAMMGGLPAG